VTTENDRKEWRLWLGLVLVFLLIAALGPVVFYGFGPLFTMMMEAPRPVSIGLLLLIGTAPAAYFFFGLWAGHKADQASQERGLTDEGRHSNG
jgi:type VI protein secretion system component VasK